MIERKIFTKLWSATEDEGLTVLVGPRHSGKSTLLRELISRLQLQKNVRENRVLFFDFDDILIRIESEPVFDIFKKQIESRLNNSLADLDEPIYLFFDEIQTNPQFFAILSSLVKTNPKKIRIIAASSVSLEKNPLYQKNLVDISRTVYLHPLSLNELISDSLHALENESTLEAILNGQLAADRFKRLQALVQQKGDAIRQVFESYLLFGSMPAVSILSNTAAKWKMVQRSLREYFEKDIHPVNRIADLEKYNQILRILSAHNGEPFNILNICDDYGLNRNTVRKYISVMQETFILDFVNPYLKDDVKKIVMRTPKLFFRDNGWVHYWMNYPRFETLQTMNRLQSALDGVLYQNLQQHASLMNAPVDIRFLKDYQNHSLDFLICRDNGLIPVGICYDLNAQRNKIHNFSYFLKYCSQISQGVLFGNFDKIEVRELKGSSLFLLPLRMLW